MSEEVEATEAKNTEEEEAGKYEAKTFAQEEVGKLLAQERAKIKAASAKDIEAAKSEGARLAKLSKDQREKEEFETQKQQFQADREQFERERLELEAGKQLVSVGVSADLAKFVVGDDAESTNSNIKALTDAVKAEADRIANDRLTTEKPNNAASSNSVLTWNDILKMDRGAQLKALDEHPELMQRN